MLKNKKVTVLVDFECVPDSDPDFLHNGRSVEYHVVRALRKLGCGVNILAVGNDIVSIVNGIKNFRPDVVFNLTEQFRYNRQLDAHVAGLLEMMDVPFTGTGMNGLILCRNKSLSKQVMSASGIDVPWHIMVFPGLKADLLNAPDFPLIVKPALEDGSDGISGLSVVFNKVQLDRRLRYVHRQFRQPAIIEEFVCGRELYVSVIGDSVLKILPPRELFFSDSKTAPVIATKKVKWDKIYRKKWGMRYGFASLNAEQLKKIFCISTLVYKAMQVSGYARIDLRMNCDGRVCVMEVNPNPNLSCIDDVARSAARAGMNYTALIEEIVKSAFVRHKSVL